MERINSLQALRAIAFMAVFLSHCGIIATGPMGVSIFLVLSGFLMYRSSCVRDWKPDIRGSFIFAITKISKLYPLHLLTLLTMIFVDIVLKSEENNMVVKAVVNALLLQAWIPDSSWYFTYNAVSWYLSVCLFIYLCFPILFQRLRNKTIKHNLILGGVVLVLQIGLSVMLSETYIVDTDFQKWMTYILPLYRLMDFFYGLLLSAIVYDSDLLNKIKVNSRFLGILEIGLLGVWVLQIVLYKIDGLIPEAFRYSLFWLLTSIVAVILFAFQNGKLTKLLSNKVFIFIGNISGVAFLIHQITIGLCGMIFENKYVVAGIALGMTIIASMLYQELDRKVRKQLKKMHLDL